MKKEFVFALLMVCSTVTFATNSSIQQNECVVTEHFKQVESMRDAKNNALEKCKNVNLPESEMATGCAEYLDILSDMAILESKWNSNFSYPFFTYSRELAPACFE